VPGDHRLLIGLDDEHFHARTFGRDDLTIGTVGFAVKLHADPFHALQHALAYAPGILANAAAEYDGIKPLQHRRETAELAPDAEDKIFDGLARFRRIHRFQLAHVGGEAGKTFEAGLLVQHVG